MTASPSFTRPLLIAVIGVALLTQGGCVWLRAKFANTAVYESSEQGNPLEVPPDLDRPNTAAGIAIPDVGDHLGVQKVPCAGRLVEIGCALRRQRQAMHFAL